LSYNLIERIENLQFFSDLRELHMESNGVARIEGLEGNKALQVLNLAGNRIEVRWITCRKFKT
jgi:Leucine-rich repeat (LRR) protein